MFGEGRIDSGEIDSCMCDTIFSYFLFFQVSIFLIFYICVFVGFFISRFSDFSDF